MKVNLKRIFIHSTVICGALRDFVPVIQFKKREKQLKPTTLLKELLDHGYFSRFLNCINDTKSRKGSHIMNTTI